MDQLDTNLWQTINEPDIDPLMIDAIRLNRQFRDWWTSKLIPDIHLERIIIIKPNFTREAEAASHQSKPGRETDLHMVFQDDMGSKHAILTESKIDAPPGPNQAEDYAKYAEWGKENRLWKSAVTVLIAPEGYLTRPISNAYDRIISYEEVAERAESSGLQALSEHLLAGIKRYQHTGEPRNPDEIVSSFRVQYSGLLRDEYPHLYELLSARGKELFDGSQKWFYFKLTNGVEIVHKISNNVYEQNVNDEQYLSLHIPGKGKCINELPDPDLSGSWRPARSNSKKKSAIYDIPLSHDARMFFNSFETESALRVWDLADTFRCRWENQISNCDK